MMKLYCISKLNQIIEKIPQRREKILTSQKSSSKNHKLPINIITTFIFTTECIIKLSDV